MTENNKYEVADLIDAAFNQKPLDFETTFSSLMVDRLRTAVDAKKQEIALAMYAPAGVEEDNVPPEEEANEES